MFKKQINMLRKQILQNLVDDLVSPERVRFENLGKFAPGRSVDMILLWLNGFQGNGME